MSSHELVMKSCETDHVGGNIAAGQGCSVYCFTHQLVYTLLYLLLFLGVQIFSDFTNLNLNGR